MLKFICYGIFFSVIGLLSGCGGEESESAENTQVVAKVNGEEVTIHQLNQLLSRVRAPEGEYSRGDLEKKALDNLVEKTLVLQAAKGVKIDREPAVLSALEEAKNKVLIERYVQRALESVAKPTDEQVQRFYDDSPELFAERKMYVFTKLAISAGDEQVEQLIEQVKQGHTIKQVVALLEQKDIKYKRMSEAKAEGKIAGPVLHFLSALQAGDVGYLKMTDGLLVVELHRLLDQSVTLEEAKGAIAGQLLLEARKKASKKLVDSLKETAEVEYVGQFAPDSK
ncbi:MAG: EpsD family peptidyl-prolyl cis-trans isomerase [Thiomicrorhabdus sp.]|nr:EpsD family peptidyl-prolyl cis-trans isomerase [Thiomicrorhabdus sp.]